MKKSHFPNRALHLVDLENLIGAPGGPRWAVADTMGRYLLASGWQPGDHVVVAACGPLILQYQTGSGVASRSIVAVGPDAADLALIAAADPTFVARRFDRVVIGSGDGIFAQLAAELEGCGVVVTVVGRGGAISRRLRSREVIRLDAPLPCESVRDRVLQGAQASA